MNTIEELERQVAMYKEDQRVSAEAYNFLHGQYRKLREALESLLSLGRAESFGEWEEWEEVKTANEALGATMELPKR